MKRGGGKQKGSAFERQVCKDLSLWLSGGKHDDWFWRSAMSGGRATVGKKAGNIRSQQAGDISAIEGLRASLFAKRFYMECKHVKSLDMHGLPFRRGFLFRCARSALREAICYDKTPLLFVKQNRLPAMVGCLRMSCEFGNVAPTIEVRVDCVAIGFVPLDEFFGNAVWLYRLHP